MSSISIAGDTSGAVTLAAPAIAGTNTMTLLAATGSLGPKVLSTAVASTSGTSIDFTGIPSWVVRITVILNNVSVSSTNPMKIQLGTSSGVDATTYTTTSTSFGSTTGATTSYTDGFYIRNFVTTDAVGGTVVFVNISGNIWVGNGCYATTVGTATGTTGGTKTLSGTLDRVRLTINGTDTFDSGSVNILYE